MHSQERWEFLTWRALQSHGRLLGPEKMSLEYGVGWFQNGQRVMWFDKDIALRGCSHGCQPAFTVKNYLGGGEQV